MATLRFRCPHCDRELRVPLRFLGQAGSCNFCRGRIAVVGMPDADTVQRATRVAERDGDPFPADRRPATEKQVTYLADLGVSAAEATRLNRSEASARIDALEKARAESIAPTDQQIAYLQYLGATPEALAGLDSRADASRLIEQFLSHHH